MGAFKEWNSVKRKPPAPAPDTTRGPRIAVTTRHEPTARSPGLIRTPGPCRLLVDSDQAPLPTPEDASAPSPAPFGKFCATAPSKADSGDNTRYSPASARDTPKGSKAPILMILRAAGAAPSMVIDRPRVRRVTHLRHMTDPAKPSIPNPTNPCPDTFRRSHCERSPALLPENPGAAIPKFR